ncbi:MAG: murein L,D-transpeptidase catalytic domain family protein [Chitinophagaceae bacterium]|nr:murein L,D-transpeptidase catalytic domain family protein [Chitinophagaceae bacterium]
MTKTLRILFLVLIFGCFCSNNAGAHAIADETEAAIKTKTEKYISYVYSKIKFANGGKLKYEVFRSAFYGYLNMLESNKIDKEGILSVCDFTLSSNRKRLWVIDLKNKKVLFHSLVAHGAGTGEEFATNFSNVQDSHQSSLGFYVTAETYTGNNGYSLKLQGMDGSFNSNAYERAIVIHGADYVSEQFARDNERLGRSHGCPALPPDLAPVIIDKIKNGTCFFIYHKANNYLSASRWLNTDVNSLPQEADLMDLNTGEVKNNPRYVYQKTGNNADADLSLPAADEDRSERVITSVKIINMNTRTGVSDTTIVK